LIPTARKGQNLTQVSKMGRGEREPGKPTVETKEQFSGNSEASKGERGKKKPVLDQSTDGEMESKIKLGKDAAHRRSRGRSAAPAEFVDIPLRHLSGNKSS